MQIYRESDQCALNLISMFTIGLMCVYIESD